MNTDTLETEMTTNKNTTKLPDHIANRFICPICKQKANVNTKTVKCTNTQCSTSFPIINEVPVLINEDNSIFEIEDYANDVDKIINKDTKLTAALKKIFSYLPTLSNNLSSKKNFALLEKLLAQKENPVILIVGGATITTDTEKIIKPENTVIESDVSFGPRTQIILDSHDIPFANDTFDLVIFQAVLEHVADPYRCIEESHRVLKPEGLIFAATPFMQQVHARAFDFTRFTHLGHRRLFRKFEEIESGPFAGTGVTLGWSIEYFVNSFFDNKYIRFALRKIVSLLFFWLKYLDYFIKETKGTYNGASGFYFIGSKSENVLSDRELVKLYRGY